MSKQLTRDALDYHALPTPGKLSIELQQAREHDASFGYGL
jgi:hypothetical protein